MKRRAGELALEAAMVVFAVLVALAVEEWRTDREMERFADRVEASVMAEVRANLDEMVASGPTLERARDAFDAVIESGDMSTLGSAISMELPDLSLAAWSAAQTTQAGPYLDYDWLIGVSRVYDGFRTYDQLTDGIVESLGVLIGTGPTEDQLRLIYGRLVLLTDMHGQLQGRLESLLEEAGA